MKNLYGEGGYEMKIFDENGNFLVIVKKDLPEF